MSRAIRIPQGLRTVDFLATASRSQKFMIEADERYRLHNEATQQIDVKTMSEILQHETAGLIHKVWDGSVVLPQIKKNIHLESSIWGSNIEMHNVSRPESYTGNVGFTHFARDISILIFREVNFSGSRLKEHIGGAVNFVSGWKKALYLLKLFENSAFLRQCRGEDGLDLFAERYFSNNTYMARSFAINYLSSDVFESLDWRTKHTNGAVRRAASEQAGIYARLLECAKSVHDRRPQIGVEPFLSSVLARADEWTTRVAEVKRSKPLRHFGIVRRRLIRADVDTRALDDIVARHGLGHREMQRLHDRLLVLAEEEGCDADELSRVAVEHGVLRDPLWMAFSKSRRQVLLKPFREYGISVASLEGALRENSVTSVATRIIGWGLMPEPKKDLMGYLGMPPGHRGNYYVYLKNKFEDPAYSGKTVSFARVILLRYMSEWIKRKDKLAKLKEKVPPKEKIIVQEGKMPDRAEPKLDMSEITALDVFHELSGKDGIPDSVLDRMDDLLEAADEVDGPLTSIQIRNLRKPFDKHFGEDVVDAALEDAGIRIN